MKRALTILFWLLPPACLAVLYWNGLQSWFQQDDFAWLGLPVEYRGGKSLWKLVIAPQAQGTIRPLSERLFFLVLGLKFGMNPAPFHAVVALTQIASLFLLQWIVLRISGSRLAALAAPVLWLCSAGIPGPLSWLSAYNQVQCAFFLLAAFVCLMKALETGKRSWWAAQFAVFVVGFGSLEFNIVYPALALGYVVATDRKQSWKLLPFLAVSAAYFLLHHFLIAKPATGVYAQHWGLSVVRMFGTYAGAALAGQGRVPPTLGLPGAAWQAAAWALGLAVCGYAVWAWRKGERLAAFGLAWFAITIGPVLPLRDHFMMYYLAIPCLGLAVALASLVQGALSRGRFWGACAAAVVLVHLGYVLPLNRAATGWHVDRGDRVRVMVQGLERAHQLHPDKTIYIEGLDDDTFWGGLEHEPQRLFGLRRLWLLPGAEKSINSLPEVGDFTRLIAPEAAVARDLAWDRAAVYRVERQVMRNITTSYWLTMPRSWFDSRPRMIDAGQPAFAHDLGPGWHALEGTWRWMSGAAIAYLSMPGPGKYGLFLAGTCPEYPPGSGPVTLRVSANGSPVGEMEIVPGTTSFERVFPMPETPAGTQLEVRLEVSRTVRADGDPRDLGLAFGQIGVVRWEF